MVVVDNNILSSLAKIDRLDWLPQVFDAVMTTPSVLDELHRDAVSGYAFVDRIDAVKTYNDGWLADPRFSPQSSQPAYRPDTHTSRHAQRVPSDLLSTHTPGAAQDPNYIVICNLVLDSLRRGIRLRH